MELLLERVLLPAHALFCLGSGGAALVWPQLYRLVLSVAPKQEFYDVVQLSAVASSSLRLKA